MEGSRARCERVLFVEGEQVLALLHQMAAPDCPAQECEKALEAVTSALKKYLELPHVLDPYLEPMMSIVMGRAKELVVAREEETLAGSGVGGKRQPGESFPFQVFICPQLHSMFCVIYQLCRVRGSKAVVRLMPHEAADLEPVIHALQAQDSDDYSTWETRYGLLQWLSMLSLVPFDIDTIDSGLSGGGVPASDGSDIAANANADEKGEAEAGGSKEGTRPSVVAGGGRQAAADLVGTIVSLCMNHLGDAGPTRDAAAACLSSLLTRPDMEACHLQRFLEWSASVLERVSAEDRAGQGGLNKLAFLVMGVMATLAGLFKQGHREKLIDLIPVVFHSVVGLAELGSGQTLLRKMLVKLLQRVGTTYVPPRVVTWRYRRGQRSLLQSLAENPPEGSGDASDEQAGPHEGKKDQIRHSPAETPTNGAEGKGGSGRRGEAGGGLFADQEPDKYAGKGGGEGGAEEAEADIDIPDELEDIVEALLCGLRDRDTVVRWSAAKGIGRITERLTQDLADDVVCSVLDLFIDAEWDGAWHGGCLALAELARRGLLLPERLPRACPIVRRALAYDVRRGGGGVGAHVRDAACYVCWAFARAYAPRVLGPHLPGLCDSMLSTALFDREVNVRRAAAAALQECVGRQGQSSGEGGGGEEGGGGGGGGGVDHGIDVITAADYFSLGNRQQAYLDISKIVAAYERYRYHIVDSLRLDKLKHWDPELRNLSALALGRLVPLDPAFAAETVLPAALGDSLSPDLLRRHGACLASAEITLALGKISYPISEDTTAKLVGIVPALEKARLYRGRGGELMRQAACRLVECLALTKSDVAIKTQLRLLDSIDETLRHAVEAVQLSAAAALKAVLKNWFPVGQKGPSERLRKRTIDLHVNGLRTGENAAVTRGHALALGVLPRKLAGASRGVLDEVLNALKDAALGRHGPPSSPPTGDGDSSRGRTGPLGVSDEGSGAEPDAETRRNAIRSLTMLCDEVGVGGQIGRVSPGDSEACSGAGSNQGRQNEESVGDPTAEPSMVSEGMREEPAATAPGGGAGLDGPSSGWCPVGLTLEEVEGVLATLLVAAEDYSVEKRGDVGSWCRMDAMTGMEKLLRLASRASRGLPLANRGDDVAAQPRGGPPESFVLPSMQDRPVLLDQPPAPTPSPHPCDQVYLTPSMVERVMCSVLKQLSEKLDSVRERAGTVLGKLIFSDDPQLPFVPERAAVKHAITHGREGATASAAAGGATEAMVAAAMAADARAQGEKVMYWASPAETFPIVVGLLAVPEYHDAIVSGLVISVGGLTESVVKHSSTALLRWLRACKSARNQRAVAGLALRLVGLFIDAKRNPRIVVPLLKTLEFLLSNECFDSLSAEEHPFAELLLAAVAAELKGCREVGKVCLGASVFVCVLDYSDPARSKALRNSVLYLAHRFPNVRKTTAEALYLKLLANEDIVDEAVYDEALDILASTPWDGDLRTAKAARSTLAKLLGVNVPTAERAKTTGNASSGHGNSLKADEMESYENLVRSVGY